jgi:excisionase family DNA binding protein
LRHQQLFGHLARDEFTADEAAEYLEVSMSTFRRFVASGRLNFTVL